MKRVLLAYNGSHITENALGEIPRMGIDPEAEVCVLVAVEKDASQDHLDEAVKKTEHAVKIIHALMPKVQLVPMVVEGSPAEAILKEATERQSDLIIIGAHSQSALERFLFGSVSSKVAAEARCSVRVCRFHRDPGFQHLRLTLAVDGSNGSKAAVANTLSRPWPHGTAIQIVHVKDPKAEPADPTMTEKVNLVASQFKRAGFVAIPTFLEGNPAKAILKHSETWVPHCILLGSRGLEHGITRPLGALASELVHGAGCEVEVIR